MRISDATCYKFTLPLQEPLELEGHTVYRRRGLLLRLTGEDGAVGWGEAAPLPGFSAESVDEAAEALSVRARSLRDRSLSEDSQPLFQRPASEVPPSVRFAVQSAVVEARADRAGTSVGALLGDGRDPVSLNALVPVGATDLTARGERLRQAGFQAVKLKVGRSDPARDAERVRALHSGLGEAVALRLDANRAWSLDEAAAFAEAIASVPIEYVEEPLARPDRLPDFAGQTGLPVALDETTRERPPEILADLGDIAAVVLKPTLLGGLVIARRWTREATSVGAATVLSSSYESGVGTRMLLALASVWADAPVGLSAHMRLSADVLRPRLQLGGPTVSAEAGGESRVDLSRLSRVETT
jgi:O-succinylbenzoate synthase